MSINNDKTNVVPSAPSAPTLPYPQAPPAYPSLPQPTNIEINNLTTAPPPPYFQPLPQMQQPVYITPIMMQPMVGSAPTRLRCPNCSGDVLTQVTQKSGCLTYAICGAICAAGLFVPCAWLGCCFLPFCIDSCKDVVHTCPNCRTYIGTYDRMK